MRLGYNNFYANIGLALFKHCKISVCLILIICYMSFISQIKRIATTKRDGYKYLIFLPRLISMLWGFVLLSDVLVLSHTKNPMVDLLMRVLYTAATITIDPFC